MSKLRDMPMITVEQNNRFREAALEVEASNHNIARQMGEIQEALVQMREERDALAAHVDRMSRLIFDTYAAIEDGDVHAIPYDEARKLHNAAPKASLARRDARMKAEALEDFENRTERFGAIPYSDLVRRLQVRAYQYRQQAEGEA